VRYGFAQTATHFYVFGGVSNGTRVNNVNRLVLATGMWESRAAMPLSSEAPSLCADGIYGDRVMHGGETPAADSHHTTLPPTLDSAGFHTRWRSLRFGFRCVQWKVFVAGGTHWLRQHGTGVRCSDQYVVAGTAAPNDFLLAGYQQVGQFLYVVGGFEAAAVARARQKLSSV
jgi:hypothetical protein